MSVDIYGQMPTTIEPPLSVPDNYDDLTPEEQEEFWQRRDHQLQESPGYRYSSSNWDWRPIQVMIERFNESYDLQIPKEEIEALAYNDRKGISDPYQCKLLARVFRKLIEGMVEKNQEIIYMNVDVWYASKIVDGRTIWTKVTDKSLVEKLSDMNPGFFFSLPLMNSVEYKPPYSTLRSQLEEFADFLENCNGFIVN